jgi:hypothetical protein
VRAHVIVTGSSRAELCSALHRIAEQIVACNRETDKGGSYFSIDDANDIFAKRKDPTTGVAGAG